MFVSALLSSIIFNILKYTSYILKDNCKPMGIDFFLLKFLFVLRRSSLISRLLIRWIRTNEATTEKAFLVCAIFFVSLLTTVGRLSVYTRPVYKWHFLHRNNVKCNWKFCFIFLNSITILHLFLLRMQYLRLIYQNCLSKTQNNGFVYPDNRPFLISF